MKSFKERRVLNIEKQSFDIIQKYCEKNHYTMSKWVVHVILSTISEKDSDLKKEIVTNLTRK